VFDKLGSWLGGKEESSMSPSPPRQLEEEGSMRRIDDDNWTPDGSESAFGPAVSEAWPTLVPGSAQLTQRVTATTQHPWRSNAPSTPRTTCYNQKKLLQYLRALAISPTPQTVLLVGFLPEEVAAFRSMMVAMEADTWKVSPCTKAMLQGTLQAALEADCPAWEQVSGGLLAQQHWQGLRKAMLPLVGTGC
jgi:hypothetical protein